MERQYSRPSAGSEHVRQLLKELIQHLKFAVDVDADSLEYALTGLFNRFLLLVFRQEGQRFGYALAELCGSRDVHALVAVSHDGSRYLLRVWLVGVFRQHSDYLRVGQLLETLRAAFALLRIHSEVERTVDFIGESALRIVYLHGAYAKVGEHEVKFLSGVGGGLVDVPEILQPYSEDILAESEVCKALFCLCGLDWVDVQRVDVSASLELFEHCAGVTAVAQGGVKTGLSRLYVEKFQYLADHY